MPPTAQSERFDFPGAAALTASLICYALGMTVVEDLGFNNPKVLLLFSGAAACAATFVYLEYRSAQPMFEPRLLHDRGLALGLLMSFSVFILLGANYLLPFYLQYGRGFSVTLVGLLMMAMPVGMGLIAPLAGACSDRWGAGGVRMTGLIVLTGGCLLVSTLGPRSGPLDFIWRTSLCGLGMGLFQAPNMHSVMSRAPQTHGGVTSGLLSLTRTLGTTTGLPLMGMIFLTVLSAGGSRINESGITAASPESLAGALSTVYRLAALIAAVSCGVAGWAWLKRSAGRRDTVN